MPYREPYDDSNYSASTRHRSDPYTLSSRSSRVRFALGEDAADSQDKYHASSWRSGTDEPIPVFASTRGAAQYAPSSYQESSSTQDFYTAHEHGSPSKEAARDYNVDLEDGGRRNEHPPLDSGLEDGYLAHFVGHDEDNNWDNLDEQQPPPEERHEGDGSTLYEQVIDEDDPLITHKRRQQLDDLDDLEDLTRSNMSYKDRRKSARAVRIQYNVSCAYFLHTTRCVFSLITYYQLL